jgi:putative transposase
MARATYYYHLKRLTVPDKQEHVRKQIQSIYHAHKGRYGYRRITLELRNQSMQINHKKVVRLMQECGLKSLVRIKKYRSYKGTVGRIAPNVLERDFNASAINKKWATDVTEFSLLGQKRYLSPIMDLYNGEIVSYTISTNPNLLMVTSMLKKALRGIKKDFGLILHSDQGWHYQHATYQEMLKKKGVIQSMSRKGNCLDNAKMENFFGLLKSELLYLQKFQSIEEFEKELKAYIFYYNNIRIKQKLKGLSPVNYRIQSLLSAL